MKSKIYIGNLSFKTSEDDLKTLLSNYGGLVSVSIVKDRFTGRSKGFGFAEFEEQDAANKAIEALNGQDFHGRGLRVNIAQDKPSRF